MNNKVKVVIPARYGSSRLPGKPLLILKEKPIYWHVVQRVVEAGVSLDNIVVATDDERIKESALNEKIPVEMTSPEHVSGTDRVNEVVNQRAWSDDTVILNVQGDEPVIPPELIAGLIRFSLENRNYPITTAVTPISTVSELNNPNIVKAIIAENNRALYFTRSSSPFNRECPGDISYCFRHIGIYGYSVSALKQFCSMPEAQLEALEKLEQLRALSFGIPIGTLVVNSAPQHGVDTFDDYERLKRLMGEL
ncbi:MAG: 3-deoxy-manno-octulosonate cytidylyltransferase [Planctomycetes bacterium]|nr:3-deoxy-manno-octulosonate cytidylyltransferase [Planctomycetota bacterium]